MVVKSPIIALAAALLAAGAAASVVVDGYVSIRSRFFRLQSNANVDDNSGVIRELTQVGFLDNEVIQTLKIEYSLNQSKIVVQNLITYLSVVPFPRVALTKTTVSIDPTSFGLSTKSFAVAYPLYFQSAVNSTTGQSLLNTYFLTGSILSWSGFKQSSIINDEVQIWNFQNCRTDVRDVCINFRLANDTYDANSTTYLPDSIKVSLELPVWQQSGVQNVQTGLISNVYFTQDRIAFSDLHSQVDQTVSDCNKRVGNANAMCSADVIVQFNSDWSDSGYLNWERSATAVLGDGSQQSVSVSATTYTPAEVDVDLNISTTGFAETDSVLDSMSGMQVVIYRFQLNNANVTKIVWDPEIGMATVNTDNKVVGGISVGALVGIVIAGAAVLAIVAGGVWYVRSRKPEHRYRFLG